jgi:UDPglucose 6-dehydrogenase
MSGEVPMQQAETQQAEMRQAETMTLAVAGLWHLGTVTAACMAAAGVETIGYDQDVDTVTNLQAGKPPLFEPGLAELVQAVTSAGTLRFTSDRAQLARADVLWAAWDTPVDQDDRADVEAVVSELISLFPFLKDDVLVLVSSQLPVGSVRRLEQAYATARPDGHASFASSPENLRLGKAIDVFTKPERIIVGVRSERDADRIRQLLAPLQARIELMGVESAEMTKHAVNAFLATSVAFMNELARTCEHVGADAREVERGLKSEGRIGPKAYLRPGGPYAGGTLARDIGYLIANGEAASGSAPFFTGVRTSNDRHKHWALDTLTRELGGLTGARVAVLGLTYKAGTDTLRRSAAVELCQDLARAGATPVAFDPAVNTLDASLASIIHLASSPQAAARGAAALVLATEWPDFRALSPDEIAANLIAPALVVDAGGFLPTSFEGHSGLRYRLVGKIA